MEDSLRLVNGNLYIGYVLEYPFAGAHVAITVVNSKSGFSLSFIGLYTHKKKCLQLTILTMNGYLQCITLYCCQSCFTNLGNSV